jgi:hypothetical protein
MIYLGFKLNYFFIYLGVPAFSISTSLSHVAIEKAVILRKVVQAILLFFVIRKAFFQTAFLPQKNHQNSWELPLFRLHAP